MDLVDWESGGFNQRCYSSAEPGTTAEMISHKWLGNSGCGSVLASGVWLSSNRECERPRIAIRPGQRLYAEYTLPLDPRYCTNPDIPQKDPCCLWAKLMIQ